MPTAVTSPVNVIAGTTTSVLPPGYSDIGNTVIAVEVYNNSSSVLKVFSAAGPRFLQPLTADLFPCAQIVAAPTFTPITFQPNLGITTPPGLANGVYLGTVTTTIYYQGDALPPIPTFSLPPFPGGAGLIASFHLTNILASLFPEITIQPPQGTDNLLFSITDAVAAVGSGPSMTVEVIGAQTGTVYGSGTATLNASLQIPIVQAVDVTFLVNVLGTGNFVAATTCTFDIYGTPATIPTFATLTTGVVDVHTNPTTVLAAPSFGAWYLFGVDLINTDTAVHLVDLVDGAGNAITDAEVPISNTISVRLGPYRTTTVTKSVIGGTNTFVVVRFALGP